MAELAEDIQEFSIEQIPENQDIKDIVMNLMANPNLAPINYFNDFSEEALEPEKVANGDTEDSGILYLDENRCMAMTTHAYHHRLRTDPQVATEILMSRATRRMIAAGVKPEAVSSMLYHINVADLDGQYIAAGAKKGLENACDCFGIKLADRKIRFDNFSGTEILAPTVIISMMGTVKDKTKMMTSNLKTKGNNVFMIGRSHDDINSSEYLEFYHKVENSPLPVFNIEEEAIIQDTLKGLIENKLVTSASPVGKGGLFFSMLRASMPSGFGFDITTDAEIRKDAFLFGESMGRMIVGVNPSREDDFVDFMRNSKLPFFAVGHVTKGEIRVDDESFGFINKMTTLPD